MMAILRDSRSGICMCGGGFRSNGAQARALVGWERAAWLLPLAAARSEAAGAAGVLAFLPAPGLSPPPSAAPAQVSVLAPGAPPRHWFTGTPDPQRSAFKPFACGPGGALDGSPHTAALPANRNPPTALWQAWQRVHEARGGRRPSAAALRELEARGLAEGSGLSWAAAVDAELQLYGGCSNDGGDA